MSDRLNTYLNDHLAGSRFAIDLLGQMRDAYIDQPMGRFAADVLGNVEQDRVVLQRIIDELGGGESSLKEAAAWFAEKASRLKFRLGTDDELAMFEALEALSLGVVGKLKLWNALAAIAKTEARLSGIDFDGLAARAREQHDQIEAQRLKAAQVALSGQRSTD